MRISTDESYHLCGIITTIIVGLDPLRPVDATSDRRIPYPGLHHRDPHRLALLHAQSEGGRKAAMAGLPLREKPPTAVPRAKAILCFNIPNRVFHAVLLSSLYLRAIFRQRGGYV